MKKLNSILMPAVVFEMHEKPAYGMCPNVCVIVINKASDTIAKIGQIFVSNGRQRVEQGDWISPKIEIRSRDTSCHLLTSTPLLLCRVRDSRAPVSPDQGSEARHERSLAPGFALTRAPFGSGGPK
jgi:hypothetical protein